MIIGTIIYGLACMGINVSLSLESGVVYDKWVLNYKCLMKNVGI
jgi:hypothetical protein